MIILLLIILIILLYLYAIWPRLSRKEQMRSFLKTMFAHRGYHCATLGVPENSMASFRSALTQGYGIELDVHLTRDGHLVVFHDDDLLRMCGDSRTIEELDLAELSGLTLLDTREHIPLFTDALALISGQVPLLIELKVVDNAEILCTAVHKVLQNYKGAFLIQSFYPMALYWFRKNAPEMLRGQLSSSLKSKRGDTPLPLRFMVTHLLTDFLGRPDFISYKLADLPVAEVWLLHRFLHVPVAVWTLRTAEALAEGTQNYDIQIFEKPEENY